MHVSRKEHTVQTFLLKVYLIRSFPVLSLIRFAWTDI